MTRTALLLTACSATATFATTAVQAQPVQDGLRAFLDFEESSGAISQERPRTARAPGLGCLG